MKGSSSAAPSQRVLLAVVALGLLALLVIIAVHIPRKHTLNGLLVDLELGDRNPERYRDLREAITRKLPRDIRSLADVEVSLEYYHYTEVSAEKLDFRAVDFVLLSPQSTPWYMYRDDAKTKLDAFKALVRDLVLVRNKPVLGICGGHQFLALAFGGSVDFIDPRFLGKSPERYPKEALAERGEVLLETLADDPILEGVTGYPGKFSVMQSHYEEVKVVPPPFVNLARSTLSGAQLMRVPGRLVYGTAFHPERGWNAADSAEAAELRAGKQVLANFLKMVLKDKQLLQGD